MGKLQQAAWLASGSLCFAVVHKSEVRIFGQQGSALSVREKGLGGWLDPAHDPATAPVRPGQCYSCKAVQSSLTEGRSRDAGNLLCPAKDYSSLDSDQVYSCSENIPHKVEI